MGARRPEHGAEPVLWMCNTFDALERHETALLIIDEFNRAARRPTMSSAIATALRDVMDRGIVPMAFLATEEACGLFSGAARISRGRLMPGRWIRSISCRRRPRSLRELSAGLDDQLVEL